MFARVSIIHRTRACTKVARWGPPEPPTLEQNLATTTASSDHDRHHQRERDFGDLGRNALGSHRPSVPFSWGA